MLASHLMRDAMRAFGIAMIGLTLAASARAGDLAWLAGAWHGGNDRETWESRFTGDEGGVVLGTYKQGGKDGALTFVELQQIDLRVHPAKLSLFANGGAPYEMLEVRRTPGRIEFSGAHAFPQRAVFVHDGQGFRLELSGRMQGKDFSEAFPMTH